MEDFNANKFLSNLLESWIDSWNNYNNQKGNKEVKQLISRISKETNETFIGEGCSSTLMATINKYDDEGRLLTPDMNYIESSIVIDGTIYKLIKKGWLVWIGNKDYHYTRIMSECPFEGLIGVVNLTPYYVYEYDKKNETHYAQAFNDEFPYDNYKIKENEMVINNKYKINVYKKDDEQILILKTNRI